MDQDRTTYLIVPHADRARARALGAQYDGVIKRWIVPPGAGVPLAAFAPWLPPVLSALRRGVVQARAVPARKPKPVTNKQCARCLCEKPVADFGLDRTMKDGRRSLCKPCRLESCREWRRANPDIFRASKAKYRRAHADAEKARKTAYRLARRKQRDAAMTAHAFQRVSVNVHA
ncbi:DUF5710 domain-containing protein [Caballeronia sp. LjRoot31]|uniref:DUF5710 domain-containing protein n=1 Tax=Caballeronia sp. LjRoot31 TaxID=3342324 RepID=UPI003F4FB0B4